MRIVFDLDDTICRTRNRDYANTSIIWPVAEKIKEFRRTIPGAEIVIYTGRGMASCKGDAVAAEKKNRPLIEKLLKEHGVEYDEIIFGKPLGDFYVDDKGITPLEFVSSKFAVFHGFSGAKVTRIGNTIVKECTDAQAQFDWYKVAGQHYPSVWKNCKVRVPEVYSVTLGKLYMEYIDGELAADCLDETMIRDLVRGLMREPVNMAERNDLEKYARYVQGRADDLGARTDIGSRIGECKAMGYKSFCNGDLSLLNIIRTQDGYAFIDPVQKDYISSFVLDLGKLRASLGWLDAILEGKPHRHWHRECFDSYLYDEAADESMLEEVKIAEETHLYRVWWNARRLGREDRADRFRAVYEMYYER